MSARPSSWWDRMREGFTRAFHVDPPGPATPTEEEAKLVERVAVEVVRRRMATPALIFLESSRPLAGVGAAAMHFLQPFVTVVLDASMWSTLATFLERGGSVEYLCRRIEVLEAERERGRA